MRLTAVARYDHKVKSCPFDPAPCASAPSSKTLSGDERGVFAPFIALIAVALMMLGSIAYDAPRIIAARQDAFHAANEAARVAAVTIASGGSISDARKAAETRASQLPLIYGEKILIASVECVGARVEVLVVSGYIMRSILAAATPRRPIVARGRAEAVFLNPAGEQETRIKYLGECPIFDSTS